MAHEMGARCQGGGCVTPQAGGKPAGELLARAAAQCWPRCRAPARTSCSCQRVDSLQLYQVRLGQQVLDAAVAQYMLLLTIYHCGLLKSDSLVSRILGRSSHRPNEGAFE